MYKEREDRGWGAERDVESKKYKRWHRDASVCSNTYLQQKTNRTEQTAVLQNDAPSA